MVASATMGVTLAGTVSDAGDVLDPAAGDLPPLSRRAAAAEAVRRRPAVRGVVWLLVSCVFFAGMNVGARVASRHVPWPEVAASRALFGALTAASVGALRGKSLRVVHQRAAWMRSLFGTTALLIGFYAVSTQSVPLGDIVTLGATSPVFIALLSAPLLGEHVGGRVWVSVPLAFAGVALVVQPSLHVALPIAGVVTVGAFASALAMIWLRKLGPGESGEAVVLHFSLVSAGAALLLSLPVLRAPDLQGALALAATGVLGGLGQITMTRAYALDRAARLSALGYVGIVLTRLFAVALLGEGLGLAQAGGSLLVIAAGWLLAAGAWGEPAAPRAA